MTEYVYINEQRQASYSPKEGYTAQCEVNLWNAVYSRPENYERWRIVDGEFYVLTDEEFAEVQAEKERLRIDSIFLTQLQFFKSLKELHGISSVTIEGMIIATGNQDYIDEYNYSSGFLRGNPIFNILGALLPETPLNPQQIDEVFENGLKY